MHPTEGSSAETRKSAKDRRIRSVAGKGGQLNKENAAEYGECTLLSLKPGFRRVI